MHVAHLISNLSLGGAETSLCCLVEGSSAMGVRHTVVSMLAGGQLRERLERAGATVIELDGHRGARGALAIGGVRAALRSSRPDLVQCWMYHANIAAAVLKAVRSIRCSVIWGIRQGVDDIALESSLTRFLIKAGAPLSRLADRVVYNAERIAEEHETLGYDRSRREVIPNGIDCERFKPDLAARRKLVAELRLADDAVLIGRVARYAPMKDYPTLLTAFSSVSREVPAARLLVVGPGAEHAEIIQRQAADLDLSNRVLVLKPRLDVERFYPALDMLVSSSSANEGFPNTIAEALASSTLVAATDVGESGLMRRGCQRIVAPGDPAGLSAAILELMRLPREERERLRDCGREFILRNYNQADFAAAFVAVWRSTAAQVVQR